MEQQEELILSISEKVKKVVNDISLDLETEVYGSFATKLSMPWSDIDFIITPRENKEVSAETILIQVDQRFRVFWADSPGADNSLR